MYVSQTAVFEETSSVRITRCGSRSFWGWMRSLLNSSFHPEWLTAGSLRSLSISVCSLQQGDDKRSNVFYWGDSFKAAGSGQLFVYRWIHFSTCRPLSALKYVSSNLFLKPHTVEYIMQRGRQEGCITGTICLCCYQLAAGVLAFPILLCFQWLCVPRFSSLKPPTSLDGGKSYHRQADSDTVCLSNVCRQFHGRRSLSGKGSC